jgi:hypothetical protein
VTVCSMLRFEDNGNNNALAEICIVSAVLDNGAFQRFFTAKEKICDETAKLCPA